MSKRKWWVLFVSAAAVVVLASCTTTGIPVPVVTSPVHGTSEPGLFILGSAPERAIVGPCVSAATTITATTYSPNSNVIVNFSKLVNDQYEEFEWTEIPAGTSSASVDVPAGCYRVGMQASRLYCDGSVSLGFPCSVVLPPTYQFNYTVTF